MKTREEIENAANKYVKGIYGNLDSSNLTIKCAAEDAIEHFIAGAEYMEKMIMSKLTMLTEYGIEYTITLKDGTLVAHRPSDKEVTINLDI